MISKLVLIGIMTIAGTSSTIFNNAEFENILPEPKVFVMKAKPLSKSCHCDNKAVIPVKLPEAAKGWFYEVTFAPKNKEIQSDKSLLDDVQGLSQQHFEGKIEDFIELEKTKKEANIYILRGKEYADSFSNCGFFYHHGKYIATKSKSGYVENTPGETFYVGIERNTEWSGLQVKVELVAVK